MAELEATFTDPRTRQSHTWRKTFPAEAATITLGRCPLHDDTRPPTSRAEWAVPEDFEISSVHAELIWNPPSLTVLRLRSARNPILYIKHPLQPGVEIKPKESFPLAPGESFTIGSTQFTFHDLGPAGDSEPPLSVDTGMTIPVSDLRKNLFANLHNPMLALQELPGLIRAVNADDIILRTLDTVLKGIPKADVTAVVTLDPSDPAARPATVHMKQQRGVTSEFRPSNQIVRRALNNRLESLFHVVEGGGSSAMQSMVGSGQDWVICAPLPDRDGKAAALYVAGGVPESARGRLAKDTDLRDAQKFVDLMAELYTAALERSQMERNISQFKRFLPERMVQMMHHGNLDDFLEPKLAPVTVLFCDLRGSCGLAEAGESDLLASWKNISETLDIMSNAITSRDGVIGDLQGDAVMGFWGWPHTETVPQRQIVNAVLTALQIQKDFERQNFRRKGSYQCGIGLAHGMAVAGKLGVYEQVKIDVFGPVVNLAARLESMTKQFGVQILVDEAITTALANRPQDPFRFRPLGRICPAGMAKATLVSELSADSGMASPQNATLAEFWKAGLKAFTEGDWDLARRYFDRYRKQGNAAKDGPLEVLVEYMDGATRPPAGWDGTIIFEKK